jgi:hypothetical protein
VGEYASVQTLIRQDHGVTWSVQSLQKVAEMLRASLVCFLASTQVAKLLELLATAFATRGKHRLVLAAGLDDVHVLLWGEGSHEVATATVAVPDGRGKRQGTVSLAPKPGDSPGSEAPRWRRDYLVALLSEDGALNENRVYFNQVSFNRGSPCPLPGIASWS